MRLNFNLSTDFLVPALGIPLYVTLTPGYLNSYLSCPDLTDMKMSCPVYILYDTSGEPREVNDVYQLLTSNKNFIFEQRLDSTHILFCFEFPKDLESDYYHILEGRYSQVSDEFISKFDKYDDILVKKDEMTLTRQLTFQYQVMTRHPDMKKYQEDRLGLTEELPSWLELWDKPNWANETILLSSFTKD